MKIYSDCLAWDKHHLNVKGSLRLLTSAGLLTSLMFDRPIQNGELESCRGFNLEIPVGNVMHIHKLNPLAKCYIPRKSHRDGIEIRAAFTTHHMDNNYKDQVEKEVQKSCLDYNFPVENRIHFKSLNPHATHFIPKCCNREESTVIKTAFLTRGTNSRSKDQIETRDKSCLGDFTDSMPTKNESILNPLANPWIPSGEYENKIHLEITFCLNLILVIAHRQRYLLEIMHLILLLMFL